MDLIVLATKATEDLVLESTPDEVLMAIDFVDKLKEVTRGVAERVEAAAIAWIAANGDLERGEVRYYVGPNKSTKCKSLRATLETLLKATSGDFDATVNCLSTSAWKHGTVRDTLADAGMGDEYESLFETKEVLDLKTGKAKGDKLQKFDGRWKR